MSETALSARTTPLFRVSGLTAAYDGRTVLEVEDLRIAEGQVTVLVGENGAGKTTLLRLLNGLLAPAAGVIEFRGLALSAEGLRAVRDQSVLVHQAPLLFRGSVGYNVALGLRARSRTAGARSRGGGPDLDTREIVRRCLRQVGLDGFERHLNERGVVGIIFHHEHWFERCQRMGNIAQFDPSGSGRTGMFTTK